MEIIFLGILLVLFYRHFRQREQLPSSNREEVLRTVVSELETAIKKHPYRTLSEQVQEYKKELTSIASSQPRPAEKIRPAAQPHATGPDVAQIITNWYSENSINMLLYIGAFLIVSSASLFVGFQWDTIQSSIKVVVLTCITLGFLASGLIFYRRPKIMNAGVVFSGIGSLLVPLCGFAYYTFVLKDYGMSLASVWLITSLISGALYVCFLKYFKSSFYTYSAGLSAVSFSLAAVQNYGLDKSYYVLAGVFSSFMLLLIRIYFLKPDKKDLIIRPLEISSNIVMGVSLIFGFIIGFSEHLLFQMEGTLSVFIASLYYIISYYTLESPWQLATSLILLPISVYFFTRWQNMASEPIAYILTLVIFSYTPLVYYFRKNNQKDESAVVQVIVTFSALLISIYGISTQLVSPSKIILLLLTALGFGALTYASRRYSYIFLSSLGLAIAMGLANNEVFHLTQQFGLSQLYLVLGIGLYATGVLNKSVVPLKRALFWSSALFLVFSLLVTVSYYGYMFEIGLVVAVLFIVHSFIFSMPKALYASNLALYFCLYCLLSKYYVGEQYQPLLYSALSAGLYAVSQLVSASYFEVYKNSAFAGLLLTPILFGVYQEGIYYSPIKPALELNSIITAYAATAIYAYEAVRKNIASLGYLSSAVGMVAVLWHIHYAGATEIQYYTMPTSIYFITLAYTRKLRGDEPNRSWLDYCGLFFLVVPTMFQSFGTTGLHYSLTLGVYGILLVLGGISLNYYRYTYAGVFAIVLSVFSQTYGLIFDIPRWMLVGLVGLIFLAVAVYLLQHRKES